MDVSVYHTFKHHDSHEPQNDLVKKESFIKNEILQKIFRKVIYNNLSHFLDCMSFVCESIFP